MFVYSSTGFTSGVRGGKCGGLHRRSEKLRQRVPSRPLADQHVSEGEEHPELGPRAVLTGQLRYLTVHNTARCMENV